MDDIQVTRDFEIDLFKPSSRLQCFLVANWMGQLPNSKREFLVQKKFYKTKQIDY